MAETLPEDYRPSDIYDEDHGGSENETERLLAAFTVLTAFSMIAVIPLFEESAIAVGVDGNVIVNGTVYPGLAAEDALALDTEINITNYYRQLGIPAPRMSTEFSELLTRSATAGMAQGIGLFEADVAALAVLDAYSIPAQNSGHSYGFGRFLGGFIGGGGGGPGGFGTGEPGGLGGGPGSSYGGGPPGGWFGGPGPGPGVNPPSGGPPGGGPGSGPPDGGPPGYGGPPPPGVDPGHAPPWEDAGSCFDGVDFNYCLHTE